MSIYKNVQFVTDMPRSIFVLSSRVLFLIKYFQRDYLLTSFKTEQLSSMRGDIGFFVWGVNVLILEILVYPKSIWKTDFGNHTGKSRKFFPKIER